jgi:hypothetical protein
MRWTAWQKVAVIRAVRNGVLSLPEVRARYLLSEEELAAWEADFDRNGISGLQQKSLRRRRQLRHQHVARARSHADNHDHNHHRH